ncbi:MAG TPA: GAF domain-containing protein [Anaerolineales bacterium]|nr:GAF domain-containing protein [Anaerolineales bacterium]HNB34626.1 GAF domain-containing protein [Anaerolineales bacterium]
MNTFNLRDFLFRDRPGDETGKQAETVITLGLGFVVTLFWAVMYQNQIVIWFASATSLTALFSLIQTIRGKATYRMVFPTLVMITVAAIAMLEGKGVHDLIWMSSLGVFLLVQIYNTKNNNRSIIVFASLILAEFIGVGILELSGSIPNQFQTDLKYIFLNSILLIGIMGAITAVFYRHRNLLSIARESEEIQTNSRERLEEVNRTLEEQVRSRSNELNLMNEQVQAKAARLQAASDISHDLMAHLSENPAELLSRAARSISEKLGYYHVGIFLLDDVKEFAVLRAANSKGGQQMLARHHQLKVGGAGIVGYVAQSGRPRIALDTGADAVFFNNPYLPETRSEIALPLRVGNSIIGVLDVQSTQSSAFNDEDTNTLMTIANQMSILLKSLESEGIGFGNAKQSLQFEAKERPENFSYRPDGSVISNVILEDNLHTQRAIVSGETVVVNQPSKGTLPTLAVPVKFRDQVVGLIHIESRETSRSWTEDEVALVQAISDRAALALENARLFADATRRAEQEETISRVTTQIGASTDFERILHTTIQELSLALGASRSFIKLGSNYLAEEKAEE